MINGLSILALIPARGGSKGLPGKNIRPALGKPLIEWTIDAARTSRYVDRLVVSSDDKDILEVARSLGCGVPFIRPAHLATDTSTSMDVVLHAIAELPGHDVVVLLQPTSPLRLPADIDAALETVANGAPSCVSVCEVEEHPAWMYRMNDSGRLIPLLDSALAHRRQDLPPVYRLNGAVYVARVEWLRRTSSFLAAETVAHVMPRERSLDIDTLEDFEAFRKAVTEEANA